MTSTATKQRRNVASQIGGGGFSHARVRRWIDSNGLNTFEQTNIKDINEQLLTLCKKDGPDMPGPIPKKPGKDATTADREEYDKAVEARKVKFTLWKEYESPEYKSVETAYLLHKNLVKLVDNLNTKETDKSKKEKATLLRVLGDLPPEAPVKKDSETDEKYALRLKKHKEDLDKFVAPGFKALLQKKCNLVSVASITEFIKTLDDEHLRLFLKKDELSHKKVRFNDDGLIAITAGCEYVVGELISIAMTNATEDGKKIIRPDHIVTSDSVNTNAAYALYRTLPHFVALADRYARSKAHEKNNADKRANAFRAARNKAHKEGRVYTKNDAPDLTGLKSFEDSEVEQGYAVKITTQLAKKRGNTSTVVDYYWNIIDVVPSSEDGTNFDHYIHNLYEQRKKEFPDASLADSIKISKNIKQFLSKVVEDFLARLAPLFRTLLEYNRVKTIDQDTVVTAYKMLLAENYSQRDGTITWNESHKKFFTTIESQIKAFAEWRKVNTDKPADVDVLGDLDDEIEEEPAAAEVEEEFQEAEEVAPARNIVRRKR